MNNNQIIKTNLLRTIISSFRNVLVLTSLSLALYGYSQKFKSNKYQKIVQYSSFFIFFLSILLSIYNINFIFRYKKPLKLNTDNDYYFHLFLNCLHITFVVFLLYLNLFGEK